MGDFEEKFPSLAKSMEEWACEEDSGFYPNEIENHCLDKQKVREALSKIKEIHDRNYDDIDYRDGLMRAYKIIEKEAGL